MRPTTEPFRAKADTSIFQPAYVARLFDNMAATYGLVNVLSSFGFCVLWRKQCLRLIHDWSSSRTAVDLMSGMGELWPDLLRRLPADATISAVDLSEGMCRRARGRGQMTGREIRVLQADVLQHEFPDASVDVVVSSFGLKTFSPTQQLRLAQIIYRMLKPGGRFAMLEISVPPATLLRWPFLLYLRHVIPLIGQLMLGNPDCYRMLSVYTESFRSADHFNGACSSAGLQTTLSRHFFGCATAVSGYKPREAKGLESPGKPLAAAAIIKTIPDPVA